MKLIIRFSGLLLYARRGNRLHALAPVSPMHPHVSVLYVERGTPDWPAGTAPQSGLAGQVMLDGRRLAFEGPTPQNSGDPKVPNLSTLTGSSVRPVLLEKEPFESGNDAADVAYLAARVTAVNGMRCGERSGATFFFDADGDGVLDPTPVALANEVFWSVMMPTGDLTVETLPLRTGVQGERMTITPAGGEVWVTVYHVPQDELPGNPPKQHQPGEVIHHFDALYDLLKNPNKRVLPEFDQEVASGDLNPCGWVDPAPPAPPAVKAGAPVPGADPVTCVGGGG
ncbi:MAG TPA: hypothetical protein VEA99_16230 [Gemmatimonadaceae bacterium]|nr:hypothetical protein [Gemmatimonadaceae bacterium]